MQQGSPRCLDAAQQYAQLGYSVFPCRCGSKAPLTQSGLRAASRDPAQLDRWFGRTGYNIGVVPPAGVIVIDIDPDEEDPLEALLGGLDLPAAGPIVATPRGGRHHYLRLAGAGKFAQRSLRPGIDIRLPCRGYVLAPPSTVAGTPYRWLSSLVSPRKLPPAAQALVDQLRKQQRAQVDWSSFVRMTRSKGERNNAITRLCGHLIRKDVEPDAVADLMLAFNRYRCEPPLPDREIERIVDSICAAEARRLADGRE